LGQIAGKLDVGYVEYKLEKIFSADIRFKREAKIKT
jgi:hypothetical protein